MIRTTTRLIAAVMAAQLWTAATLGQAPAGKPKPAQNDPDAIISSANAPLPQRETDYIRLIFRARRQYTAGRSVDARRDARMDMQIAVHRFMGLAHYARDWIGVFKASTKSQDGTLSLQIEVAPGVTIGTWDNSARDKTYGTLIKAFSPLGKVVDGLEIGDTVVFSADLLGTAVGGDDDMIQRPQVVARFTSLAKYDAAPQAK